MEITLIRKSTINLDIEQLGAEIANGVSYDIDNEIEDYLYDTTQLFNHSIEDINNNMLENIKKEITKNVIKNLCKKYNVML